MPSKVRALLDKLAQIEHMHEVYVFFHYDEHDVIAKRAVRQYLCEGGKTLQLGKGRSVRFDRAHVPGGQDHLHFLQKGNNLFALNRDGTAHDRSHGIQMAKWTMDYIKTNHPEWTVPKNGLIEAMLARDEKTYLIEANESSGAPVLLDPRQLIAAENLASISAPLG